MSDIEELLDHYAVTYRPTSGNQSIRCPIHDDRTASATLNLSKEVFNCHACGAAGDVISLVMKREGLEFASAKRFVEKVTGRVRSGARTEPRPSKPVPPGSGYRPRHFRKVQTRIRKRVEYT